MPRLALGRRLGDAGIGLDLQLGGTDRALAVRAAHLRVDRVAALAVDHAHRALAVRPSPAVALPHARGENRNELAALLDEHVRAALRARPALAHELDLREDRGGPVE